MGWDLDTDTTKASLQQDTKSPANYQSVKILPGS